MVLVCLFFAESAPLAHKNFCQPVVYNGEELVGQGGSQEGEASVCEALTYKLRHLIGMGGHLVEQAVCKQSFKLNS